MQYRRSRYCLVSFCRSCLYIFFFLASACSGNISAKRAACLSRSYVGSHFPWHQRSNCAITSSSSLTFTSDITSKNNRNHCGEVASRLAFTQQSQVRSLALVSNRGGGVTVALLRAWNGGIGSIPILPYFFMSTITFLVIFLLMSREEHEIELCKKVILDYYTSAGTIAYERSEVSTNPPLTHYYLVDSYDNEWTITYDPTRDKASFLQVVPYREKLSQSSDMMPFCRDEE